MTSAHSAAATSVIYLDRHHLNDTLFLRAMAHAVARRPRDWQTILVHGPGSFLERWFEGKGIFLDMEDGAPVAPPPEIAPMVDTALHDFNRRLTRLLTENMVHAVGVAGSDRGLLVWEGGRLRTGRADWLKAVLRTGVVPLMSATAAGPDGSTQAVPPSEFLPRLIDAVGGATEVVFFSRNNLPGIMRGSDPIENVTMADVRAADVFTEPDVMEAVVLTESPVLITNPVRYPSTAALRGSYVRR